MRYDMTDPLIREMVDTNHRPGEYASDNRGAIRFVGTMIRCKECQSNWPCDARRQLLAWHEASATPRDDEIKIAGRFVDATTFDNGEGP